MTYIYNVMNISSMQDFSKIHGRMSGDSCQVFFLRCIGQNSSYINDLKNLDENLLSSPNHIYKRITSLPQINDTSLIQKYSDKSKSISDNNSNDVFFANACRTVCEINKKSHPNYNQTIENNLMVSLLYWSDLFLSDMLDNKGVKHRKLIYSGKLNYREYSFFYFATLMGIDVMLLLPEGDTSLPKVLSDTSAAFTIGSSAAVTIPEMIPVQHVNNTEPTKNSSSMIIKQSSPVVQSSKAHKLPSSSFSSTAATNTSKDVKAPPTSKRRELSYEELAQLAASVVMIAVEDHLGNIVSTGSGIAISDTGYILTNCHVASGGHAYYIRIENDDQAYKTYSLVKYHPEIDLAILKIDRSLKPLKVYSSSTELVRGQKVFAIGSPLGLFNSVSDGIISGFRNMNETEMIQFTAPVSHGSSGGAVLNTYGEIIGICTAGFEGGQNINLAVSYKHIQSFIENFITQ